MTPPTPPLGTPTPWLVKPCGHGSHDCCLEIVPASETGKTIAGIFLYNAGSAGLPADVGKANANLIVQAANNHDALVEALAAFLGPDGHTVACVGAEEGRRCLSGCARARAALKLARGKT